MATRRLAILTDSLTSSATRNWRSSSRVPPRGGPAGRVSFLHTPTPTATSWPRSFAAKATAAAAMASSPSSPAAAVTATLLPTGLATLHLARPAKLNALDTAACEALAAAVRALEANPACRGLLLTGGPAPNGRPAFCAGGDVRAIRAAALADPFPPSSTPSPFPPPPRPGHPCERVFQAEYSLLTTLATSRLPAVSIVDGVWMGLGVGLALAAGGGGGGAGVRVATEKTLAAMPECAIGLFPDVAFASLAAAHLKPPGVGLWMGLTGGRVSGGAATVGSGLATHAVPSADLPSLVSALQAADLGLKSTPLDLGDPASVVAARSVAADALVGAVEATAADAGSSLPAEDTAAGAAFSSALASVLPLLRPAAAWRACSEGGNDSSIAAALTDTLAALDAAAPGNPAAAAAAAGLRAACPLSLALTVRLFADPSASFPAQLEVELPPASRLAGSPHFAEGVRCALVDRGASPTWPPPGEAIGSVSDATVEALLAPLPTGGLRAGYWEEDLDSPGGGK